VGSRFARSAALAVPLALVAMLLALVLTGNLGQSEPGLPDAGAFVRLALPICRTVQDLSAALTVGLLFLAAFVLPPTSVYVKDELTGVRARSVRFAAVSSTCWLLFGMAALVLTYADVAGLPLTAPGFTSQLGFFLREIDLGRSMLASLVLAAVVSVGTMLVTRMNALGWLAVLSVVALLPLALAGHAAGSDDHQTAVDSLGVHLVGVSIWVGGLAALVLLSPWVRGTLGVTARRYSTVAGWCFAAVAASGVVNAWLRVGSLSGLATSYGAIVLAKTAALVLLGTAGWWHRRSLLPRLDGGDPDRVAFLRLATAEVLLMGVAVGLGVALSQSAPPVSQTTVPADAEVTALLGFSLPPPASVTTMLTRWYIEPLWLTAAVLAAVWYVVAVRRLRARGDRWSLTRTVSWLTGCLVLAWATSGGPGVYGRVTFSAHMLQHMTLMMVVPLLLVLGSPVSLALRTLTPRRDGSRGPREWLLAVVHSRAMRVATFPVVAAVLFVGSLVVFYYTPLFELSLSTHTGHLLMIAHFLLVGYLFCWVLIGVDPGPARTAYPIRLLVLFVAVSFHAFFGVAILASTSVLGQPWYSQLGFHDNAALLADQHAGGSLAWGLGELPTLALVIAVAILWSRSEDRAARRADRQADRDGDAELSAYNDYLAGLSRDPARPQDRA
jgi:cytochrome c oxidase assembly factor CtaG/putative copper export protein